MEVLTNFKTRKNLGMSKLDDQIKSFNQELKKNTKKEISHFNKYHKYLYKTGTLMRKNSKRYRQYIRFRKHKQEKFEF